MIGQSHGPELTHPEHGINGVEHQIKMCQSLHLIAENRHPDPISAVSNIEVLEDWLELERYKTRHCGDSRRIAMQAQTRRCVRPKKETPQPKAEAFQNVSILKM